MGLVLARAIVRDVYGPEEAARVIATLVMVMVVLPMMSPLWEVNSCSDLV